MLNLSDIAGINTGINPVEKIMPVLAVESIGSTTQELTDRATQFVKGQAYVAQILSKASGAAYNVKVEGAILKMELGATVQPGQTLLLRYLNDSPARTFALVPTSTHAPASSAAPFVRGREYVAQILSKAGDTTYNVKVEGAVLKAELGFTAQAGQTLSLRYMHDSPLPTFSLAANSTSSTGTTADLSPAAHLIGHYLKEAESGGVSTRYEATAVVTHTPKAPQVMAQDLKQAVNNSGLFYESHLGELVQGVRSLAAILQEPQNQPASPVAALMSQQLAILENQSMAWHGEIWPGQEMSWDVYLRQRNSEHGDGQQAADASPADEPRPVASEMTLHFPRLGKVTARLILIDGRMRINILAEQAQTLHTLESKRQNLAAAIVKNGQQLDALTVVRHE